MPTYGPGTDTYDVPPNAQYIEFDVRGAGGGEGDAGLDEGSGGDGGEVTGKISADDLPSTLEVRTGGKGGGFGDGGTNGGGDGGEETSDDGTEEASGGGGGGLSAILPDGGSIGDAFVVAGGGGGGGANSSNYVGSGAGDGGVGAHPDGGGGRDGGGEEDTGGGGGTQTSGGAGGDGESEGEDGSQGQGGDGGAHESFNYEDEVAAGGGGGAGYYGGGGGGAALIGNNSGGSGGGGGSSYTDSACYDVDYNDGVESSDGSVEITAVVPEVTGLSDEYVGANEVELDWNASDMDEYEVERDGSVTATVSDTSYTDDNTDENTEYDYQVFGLTNNDRADSTDTITVTTGGPPETTDIVEIDRGFELPAGGLNGNFDSLQITRDSAEDDDIEIYNDDPDVEVTDDDLLDGLEYTYSFIGVYPRGDSSAATESETLPLPAPTDLNVTSVGEESIGIEWSATHNTGETRADYREADADDWVKNGAVDYNTESLTVDGLLNGEEYEIRVVAVTADSEEADT